MIINHPEILPCFKDNLLERLQILAFVLDGDLLKREQLSDL